MPEQDVTVLKMFITYIVPIVAMAIGIFTYYNAVKERHTKSAAEQAGIGVKLDALTKALDEIKATVEELRKGQHENQEDITKLETKVTGLEGRVKRVEINLKDLEQKVHSFHTN